MLTGNVTFDLVTLVNRDPPLVTPYVVVGAGLSQTRESFLDNDTFTSSEGAFTAGGGVRASLSAGFSDFDTLFSFLKGNAAVALQ